MADQQQRDRADAAPIVPLSEKEALTYAEVEALGYCSARQLRRLVMMGRVKRCVLRPSTQVVRFLRNVLIEELRERDRGGRRRGA